MSHWTAIFLKHHHCALLVAVVVTFSVLGCPSEERVSLDRLEGRVIDEVHHIVSGVEVFNFPYASDTAYSDSEGTYRLMRGFPYIINNSSHGCSTSEEYLGLSDFALIYSHPLFDTTIA